MNLLEQWIEYGDDDPVNTMNTLQAHGIVSDNAMMPGDVADQDCAAAVAFLAG